MLTAILYAFITLIGLPMMVVIPWTVIGVVAFVVYHNDGGKMSIIHYLKWWWTRKW